LSQRRIGEKSHLFAQGDLGQANLECPVEQIIGVLDRDDARALSGLRCAEEAHRSPGRLVREADLAHLAGLDETAKNFKRLLDGFSGPSGRPRKVVVRSAKRGSGRSGQCN
jgi:hypothetical protein